MKAEILHTGALRIISESEVEAYALKAWSSKFLEENGPVGGGTHTIVFVAAVPMVEPPFSLDDAMRAKG